MNPYDLPRRADIAERAGYPSVARWLRRSARLLGVPVPPPASRAVELPALAGFSPGDLEGLGIRWRRDGDGQLLVLASPKARSHRGVN